MVSDSFSFQDLLNTFHTWSIPKLTNDLEETSTFGHLNAFNIISLRYFEFNFIDVWLGDR